MRISDEYWNDTMCFSHPPKYKRHFYNSNHSHLHSVIQYDNDAVRYIESAKTFDNYLSIFFFAEEARSGKYKAYYIV